MRGGSNRAKLEQPRAGAKSAARSGAFRTSVLKAFERSESLSPRAPATEAEKATTAIAFKRLPWGGLPT